METRHRDTDLGRALFKARERRGWSQARLAREAKVSRVSISKWESGKVEAPKMVTIRKLAKALDMPVEALLNPLGEAVLARKFAEFEAQAQKIVQDEATPHTAPSLIQEMQDLLAQALHETERGGAISEEAFGAYMVRGLEVTHAVQAALDQQQRQLAREMDALREREQFFARHAEQGPPRVEAS